MTWSPKDWCIIQEYILLRSVTLFEKFYHFSDFFKEMQEELFVTCTISIELLAK